VNNLEEYRLSRISNSLSLSLVSSKIAMALEEYRADRVQEFVVRHGTALRQAEELLDKIKLGHEKIADSQLTGGDIVDAISVYTAAIDALTRDRQKRPLEVLEDHKSTLTRILSGSTRVERRKVLALKKFFYETAEACLRETNEQLAEREQGETSWEQR